MYFFSVHFSQWLLLLYVRHQKSKEESDRKFFPAIILQHRKMWEEVGQGQTNKQKKLCKYPKRRYRQCVERV
jgi:hypothetical protein